MRLIKMKLFHQKLQNLRRNLRDSFLFVFLFSIATHAATPSEDQSFQKKMIETNIEVSEELDSYADKIDIWLTGKRVSNKKNETRVFIESQMGIQQESIPNYSSNIGAELKLPNFEEHWRLKFSNRNRTEERGQGPRYLQKQTQPKKVGASVGFFRNLGGVRTQYQPKILLQSQPEISHSLEFSQSWDLEYFKIEHELELFADADLGTGVGHGLIFSKTLNKKFILRQSNDSRYLDRTHFYNLTSSLTLGESLTKTSGLGYSTFISGINREVYHMSQFGFSIGYSETIYKKILDYSVTLHQTFSEELKFRGIVGLTFVVVLNF